MKLDLNQPPIGAFMHQASLLAILTTKQETLPWIYSNYIQIYCVKGMLNSPRGSSLDFFYNFYGDFRFFEHHTCAWILTNRYPRCVVKEKWGNELGFVKERINNHEYILMVVNKKYYYHLDKDFFHPVLIYGYDEEEKKIHYADSNQYGRYQFQHVSYDKFMLSNNVPFEQDRGLPTGYGGRPEGLCAFSFRDVVCEDLTVLMIDKIMIDLESYLNPPSLRNTEFTYGINCIDELITYYENASKKGFEIDIRGIYALIDHKVLMSLRLEYIEVSKRIFSGLCYEYKEKVESVVKIVLSLLLKYNLTKNSKNIMKCHDYLNEVKLQEQIILNKTIHCLKENIPIDK